MRFVVGSVFEYPYITCLRAGFAEVSAIPRLLGIGGMEELQTFAIEERKFKIDDAAHKETEGIVGALIGSEGIGSEERIVEDRDDLDSGVVAVFRERNERNDDRIETVIGTAPDADVVAIEDIVDPPDTGESAAAMVDSDKVVVIVSQLFGSHAHACIRHHDRVQGERLCGGTGSLLVVVGKERQFDWNRGVNPYLAAFTGSPCVVPPSVGERPSVVVDIRMERNHVAAHLAIGIDLHGSFRQFKLSERELEDTVAAVDRLKGVVIDAR